MEEEQLQH